MAELNFTAIPKKAVAAAPSAGGAVNVQRRVLIRTASSFEANTTLDIIAPGPGWIVFGDDVTFSGASEFTEQTQVFRNGVIQLTALSASDDNDVYFVSASGSIAFEFPIITNDVIQLWKFEEGEEAISVTSLNTLSGLVTITGAGNVTITTDTVGNIITVSGTDTDISLASELQKRKLIRTGGELAANTTIDLSNPGSGWNAFGDSIVFADANEFVEDISVFHNGILQLPASGSGDDNDVYFVSADDSMAFEFPIGTNDVVQIWKTITTSG